MSDPGTARGPDADEGFSYRPIWWLGVGILGIQLAFAVYNAFLPLLYREFVESRAVIGLLMGTDNLVGILLIPLVGAWSDRVNSPLGRRLPFVAVAVPLAALTLFAIPVAATLLWTLILAEVAFTIAMHAYRGPMAAMILDHTPPAKRSTSSGIAQFLGSIGVLISFAVLSPLYDVDPRLTFGGAAAVLLLSLVIVWWKADRAPAYIDNSPAASRNPFRDATEGLRVLFLPGNRGPLLILTAMLCSYVGFAGLQAMFPIYGVETLGVTEGRAAFMLTAFAIAFLVSALAAGAVGTRFGKIPTMLVGLAILPVLYGVASVVREPVGVVVVLVVAGLSWPLFAVPAVALVADLGGRDRIGFYIGLYYLFTMLGQMVGPFLLGSAMDVMGNHGMWVAAAVVTLLAFVVLAAARRELDLEPELLARVKHLT